MKKNYQQFVKASNAVEAAAPASVWGKCVPGKRTARNYDSTLRAEDVRKLCFGTEQKSSGKSPETGQPVPPCTDTAHQKSTYAA